MEQPSPKDTMPREFKFQSLPDELEVRILEHCDLDTLFNMCLVSSETFDKARPVLWETIDFVSLQPDRFYDDEDTERHRRFFVACERTK